MPARKWQRPSKAIVDGDAKCRSIAAASIIAKVTRDRIMADYAREYPGYGWETQPRLRHARALARAARARADAAPPPQLPQVRAAIESAMRSRSCVFEIADSEFFESHPPEVESVDPSDDSTCCGSGRARPPELSPSRIGALTLDRLTASPA